MAGDFASVITQNDVSSTRVVAANGQSINVHGMVFSNTHASNTETIRVQTTDGNDTNLMELSFAARETTIVDIHFLADKGLQITAVGSNGANIEFTVFHSQVGA